jgi:hypothetical protein
MLRKALRSVCAIALLTCLMGASGSAQTYDKRTVFTFSGPVMYPKDQARRLAEGAGQPGVTPQARATATASK